MCGRRSRGFTIIELLVVIAICSILLAIILPAVQSAREAARGAACLSNVRQIALALHEYESAHRLFPPGSQVQDFVGEDGFSKSFGWTISVLPYLEQTALYIQFDTSLDAQIHHRSLTSRRLAIYVCPSDPNAGIVDWRDNGVTSPSDDYSRGGWGTNNYLGVSGVNGWITARQPTECGQLATSRIGNGLHSGIFYGNSNIGFRDIPDGASTTLLLGERAVTLSWGKWGGSGVLPNCPMGIADVVLPGVVDGIDTVGGMRRAIGNIDDRGYWWSWHRGGCHFAAADGSAKLLSYTTDRSVLARLSNRSDSKVVEF